MNTKFKINDFVEQKSTNIKLKIIDVELFGDLILYYTDDKSAYPEDKLNIYGVTDVMALYKCFDELPERINEMYKNKKMEKKVLTEILRIKELIGGKNLLTEETLPVKILRALSSIFKNETDDVVKKIIKSNDNLVEKLKNGNLNPEEAALVIKNAGGLEAFYYKTARETFNQKNYKDYYINFQNLKKIGTMDKLQSYNDMIDQSIPKLLPNASEEYITEMKNMLKDELQTYIENKTKTNPFLQDDVPNKKNPSLETPNNKKVEEPISSGEEPIKGGSFLDNISF